MNKTATFLRNQALALLQEASNLDGLHPFLIAHTHKTGTTIYTAWSKNGEPCKDACISVLEAHGNSFDEDSETIAIDAIDLPALTGFCSKCICTSQDEGLTAEFIRTKRTGMADEEVAEYAFGSGVTVVGQSSWDTNDLFDLTKIIYVKFDGDTEDDDSHRLSFHVRFNALGDIEDAYALDMKTGGDVGDRAKKK